MEQMLAQGDRIRAAKETLDASLKAIEQSYSSSDQPHSGGDDCERCTQKKADIRRAYYTYYLNTDPDKEHERWAEKYRRELDERYNDPQTPTDDLHAWFRSQIREVVRDICQAREDISPDALMEIFHDERPTNDSINIILTQLQQSAPNPDAAAFTADLQKTKTPEERAQIYIKYYCSSSPNDSSLVKNFKAKYARMFEEQKPFDEVLNDMQKEAEDSKSSRLAGLRRQLNELEMAQSAHMKAQARKDQKRRDREPSPGVAQCSLDGCANEINLATEEIVECAVCEWLERKGSQKGRAFYCSVEHAEDDFDEHDRHDHQCCMGARCYYYPQPGPPGETGDGGLCQDCMDEEFTSYFCSQDCYHHNLDLHRDDFHLGKGIHNDSEHLEMFRPAADMEIVS
ncbi:hypothetical protein BDZ45DRAFT_747631 [Acephala macrosclerotiorum]|nr:hypothetical protein BDZ45DRAFT_747631 [Acephala macrosclerotiorum]